MTEPRSSYFDSLELPNTRVPFKNNKLLKVMKGWGGGGGGGGGGGVRVTVHAPLDH